MKSQSESKSDEIKYLFFNGDIVPYEKAMIHISTPAYRYGAMVFEGIRGYWNDKKKDLYLFRVAEHCRRFNQSLKMTRMDLDIKEEEMVNNLVELVKKNEIRQTVHFIYSAYVDGDGPMASLGPIGTAATVRKVGRMYDTVNGIRCSVSNWRRNTDEACPMRIKAAANYHNSRLALLQAKQDGYDSTILLNQQGKVCEGPGACLFMVREGRLITPSVTDDILESVTRDTVIRLYKEKYNHPVIERPVDRSELYIAEELFFCGSGAEIVPIVNVDGFAIQNEKPGAITKEMTRAYLGTVTGGTRDYTAWRTSVYA